MSVELTAQWTAIDYNITYNNVTESTVGGALGTNQPTQYTIENAAAISDPARAGYEFTGWTVTGVSSLTGNANKNVSIPLGNTGAVTLTANWTVDTTTGDWSVVTFDGNSNGGAVSNLPDAIRYNMTLTAWADNTTFPATAPTRAGYTFAGWNTTADGTGNPVSNLAYFEPLGADVTVYAQWNFDGTQTAVWKTVTFNGNGGSSVANVPTDTLYFNTTENEWRDGATFPATTPTRAGYTYDSWNATADGTGATITGLANLAPVTENKIVYAKWTIVPTDATWAAISFDANGGANAPASILFNKTEKQLADGVNFPTTVPTLAGYGFAVWNTQANGNGSIVDGSNLAAAITADTTLYAVWNANGNTAYSVEHYLVAADGSASKDATTSHTAKTDTTATATPKTYEHYTLDSAHASAVTSGNVAGDGSLVLRLYYQINRHNVSYKITGTVPSGAPSAPAVTKGVAYGENVNVAANLEFTGYTFSGWKASGISASKFSMPDKDVEFTASWTKNTVTPPTDSTEDPTTPVTPATPDPTTPTDTPDDPEDPAVIPPLTTTEVVPEPNDNPDATPPTTTLSPQGDLAAVASGQGIPSIGFGDNKVPLFGPTGIVSWSMLNMILAAVALIIFIIMLARVIKRRSEYGQLPVYENVSGTGTGTRIVFVICGAVVAVAAIVAFFLTEDLSAPVAIADAYSAPMALAVVLEVVAYKLALPATAHIAGGVVND
jgi:uncharacterized repeat protein (TIGR02543 family)